MPLELRDYQIAALTDLYRYFERETGNPLVVTPTGGGKALEIAEWTRGVFTLDPRARVLILTHVRELVEQNYHELLGQWPEALPLAGIYSAGLKRRELHRRILFASIQSIYKRALQVQQCDMVIIDEAHLVPRSVETMYGRFLAELKALNPAMKIIGFTATPFRVDSGLLHEGAGRIFTDVAHETSPRTLIDKGYLVPLRSKVGGDGSEISTEGVHTRMGEFVAKELNERAMDPDVIEAICDDLVAKGGDRRAWIVFGCSIEHCRALEHGLFVRGVHARTVSAETPSDERAKMLAMFKAGDIRAMCSVGVLTTGFNAKHVDLIALARPTKSTGLYIQMVGRGTRCLGADIDESVANGKADCLVLDYGGNIRRHGPFDEPFLPHTRRAKAEGDEPGEAPTKTCPECDEEVLIATLVCPACGFEFPPRESKVATEADEAPILAPPPVWIKVDDVGYSIHKGKGGKPDTLEVTYRCGLSFHREWICFDHPAGSYPRRAAERWWRLRRLPLPNDEHHWPWKHSPRASDFEGVPKSVRDAFCFLDNTPWRQHFVAPSAIRVKKEGKYTRITDHRIDDARLPYLRPVGSGVPLSEPEALATRGSPDLVG